MFSLDPRGGHNRYKFNKDFFKKWSHEMAYVLGFMYADGNIVDSVVSRTQYVSFDSTDRDILESMKVALSSNHKIQVKPEKVMIHPNGTYKSREIFKLRIGSRKMFDDLIKLGVTPRKSLTIKFPSNIPSNCFGHFIRGYFDGDGCVTIKTGVGKYGQRILKGIAIIFTSGSEIFLKGLRDEACRLGDFGMRSVYYGKSSRAYYLKYDTFESLEWFKLFYGNNISDLFLERKVNIFKKYFKLRLSRVDLAIENILKSV